MRCRSKDVNGVFLEEAVWNDIEQFLRNPGEVAEILRQKISARTHDRVPEFDRRSLEIALETKAEERARVLGLFRKGRIDEAALDSWTRSKPRKHHCGRRLAAVPSSEPQEDAAALSSVPAMLEKLREKLDKGVTWEVKRQLVEVLVDGIRIHTIDSGKNREAVVNVRYKFVSSVETCTDRSSYHKRDRSTKPECRIGGTMIFGQTGAVQAPKGCKVLDS